MPGLRETKKAATKNALARAAAEIALTQGTDELTVGAIASRAGVSTRTFHNYFASRETALICFALSRVHSLAESFNALPDGMDTLDAVEEVVVTSLRNDGEKLNSLGALLRVGDILRILAPTVGEDRLDRIKAPVLANIAHRNPHLTEFEVVASLELVCCAAGCALETYYRMPEPRNVEDGVRLIREAFNMLRVGSNALHLPHGAQAEST